MKRERTRAATLVIVMAAMVVATAYLSGLGNRSSEGTASSESREHGADQASYSRYGSSAPRYLDDYADRGRRFESKEAAAADLSYTPVWVSDSSDRDELGFVVVEQTDDVALAPGMRGVIQFFDGFSFEQWPHESEDAALEGLESLASLNSAFKTDVVESVRVRGNRGYLVMATPERSADTTVTSHIYVSASQLAWVEGDVYYSIRSYDNVPRGIMIAAAQSVSGDVE